MSLHSSLELILVTGAPVSLRAEFGKHPCFSVSSHPPRSPIQQSCWVPPSQTTSHPMLLKHLLVAVATPGVVAEEDLCFCFVT